MSLIAVELPEALLQAAQLNPRDLSAEAARLLALELFREHRVSLGRAAELCGTPVEAFMEFAAEREVPLHYGPDELAEDRQSLQHLFH